MRLELLPALGTLRDLYAMPRDMARFREYVARLTGGTGDVVLPLTAANPMGREHVAAHVQALIDRGAEARAAQWLREAEARLVRVPATLRVALLVVDDVAGGWTDRGLTDAQHRFECAREAKRGFATAYAWTSEPPDLDALRIETLASVYRAAYVLRHGEARTLREAMRQEGLALAFAGARLTEPRAARAVLDAHLDDPRFATLFAGMYGDPFAERAGHKPLGVPGFAGFAVGLAEVGGVDPVAALAG